MTEIGDAVLGGVEGLFHGNNVVVRVVDKRGGAVGHLSYIIVGDFVASKDGCD